jgi:hypothetical protein
MLQLFRLVRSSLLTLSLALGAGYSLAQDADIRTGLAGQWVINDELSDNTDDAVEEAIEAGGGKGGRGFFNRQEDFYRACSKPTPWLWKVGRATVALLSRLIPWKSMAQGFA